MAKDDGYYLVLAPPPISDFAEASLAEAASLLRLKVPELNRILGVGQPVPLSRVATSEEAALIGDRLRTLGIESVTVSNEDLHLEVAAKRIRALEVSGDSLSAFAAGSGEKLAARWGDVILIVAGRLVLNRVEVEERKRRGRKQLVDSRHLSTDEPVLDLYTRSCDVNWRIGASNFDFSCLGSAKAATTFENFAALISLLRKRAADAQFDDSYILTRPALATVWPVQDQTRKGEWRRSGAGKFEVATVTTTDNETQFRRYSRLRHHLKLRELMDGA